MKIALIGMSKLRYMPYVHFYLDKLDPDKHQLHLICWNRDGEEDVSLDSRVTRHTFYARQLDEVPLSSKLPNFWRYRNFLLKTLRQIQPDFLIIHYSTAGILLLDRLATVYRQRYILDYRDVTYERIPLYKKLVAQVVKHARLTFTSSDGFRPFLPPKETIYTSHNVNFRTPVPREALLSRLAEDNNPIRIAFWGMLRSYPMNKIIIEKLGNDPRFQLHYYGRAQGDLLELMHQAQKQYSNVFYHGVYRLEERAKFAIQADLLHNLYEPTDKTAHIAMGNKYYDGFLFYLPQLCTEGSFMAEKAEKAGIGFPCDPEADTFADDIAAYYRSLDKDAFRENCDREYGKIFNEVQAAETIIDEILC